jgi:Tfp pilus assembly protein PilF
MHQQTLELKKKVLGPEHPDTLISMNNLGLVLSSQGRYEEAEAMNRRALAGAGGAAAGGLGNLDWLRNNPQFQQLRQVVQLQPQMLEPILQSVGAGNPQLAQLFLQLLGEDGDDDACVLPDPLAPSSTP